MFSVVCRGESKEERVLKSKGDSCISQRFFDLASPIPQGGMSPAERDLRLARLTDVTAIVLQILKYHHQENLPLGIQGFKKAHPSALFSGIIRHSFS